MSIVRWSSLVMLTRRLRSTPGLYMSTLCAAARWRPVSTSMKPVPTRRQYTRDRGGGPSGLLVPAFALLAMFSVAVVSTSALPPQPSTETVIEAGIAFLKRAQNGDGSWTPAVGPAITALAVAAMLDAPGVTAADAVVQRGIRYILSHRRSDGGIHAGMLGNYNTAICVSALARLDDHPTAKRAVNEGRRYLIGIQWHGKVDATGVPIDRDHPFFGGSGYGRHGRPDMSNTQVMLQALRDSGLPSTDAAYQRALVFITRCQGITSNDMYAPRIAADGGFIYSTSTDADHVYEPQSMAGTQVSDATAASVSTLRTYGSMTYAGFKSYIYAGLDHDDPRVVEAHRWICRHYTVTENPGMPEGRGQEGYFYYLVTMARALDAAGQSHLVTPDGVAHDWAADLTARLVALQQPDGSWINTSSRWMETDPNLVTAFALTALHCAAP